MDTLNRPSISGVLKDVTFIWSASADMWKGNTVTVSAKRLLFFVRALWVFHLLRPFFDAPPGCSLGKSVKQRPEIIGAVLRPYQCSVWNTKTRLTKIVDHYSVMDEISQIRGFPVDSYIELLCLSEVYKGFRVIISQPSWLLREGLLTMHLFIGPRMIYSLSFSFFHHDNDRAAFIGQIQGVKSNRALEQYRELTKAFHGVRPRDLLIEIFRIFCSALAVKNIFAVAEEYQHHYLRYSFFEDQEEPMSANYNDIWEDRGGVRVNKMSYHLDVDRRRRSHETIAAKKRRMYERRYEMLDRIEQQVFQKLSSAAKFEVHRHSLQ
jgi:uncharacterized protein VirK/YbjX